MISNCDELYLKDYNFQAQNTPLSSDTVTMDQKFDTEVSDYNLNKQISETPVRTTFGKVLDCFFLLRIPLLAPVWTILILGWISGNENATPGGVFSNPSILSSVSSLWFGLFGFSLLVASIYVVNQIVDIESDRINHKLFLLPHKIISIKTAWILAILCAFSGFIIGFILGPVFIVLFTLSLILGIMYNLPPFEMKNHAWGGVIANFLGHGVLTFMVGWFLSKNSSHISLELLKTGLLSSAAAGFANGAVFLATTIPDAEGDSLTGKKTFCVKFGEKNTARMAAILCLFALVFSFLIEFNKWVMIIPSMISMVLFILFSLSTKREVAFQVFKWPVFLLSATVAGYIPEYGILILATFFGSRFYYRNRFGIDYPTFKSK